MRGINRFSVIIAIIVTFIFIYSCAGLGFGKAEPAEEKDPYDDFPFIFPALQEQGEESTPEPQNEEPRATATPRPKVLVKARILEYNKATKMIYINVGSSTSGIKVGLEGKIYNDKALTQENGIVKLTKVYPGYSEGVARNQNYEINPTAAIAVFEIVK
jgi:hypothetical protein